MLPFWLAPVATNETGTRRSGRPALAGVAQLVEQLIRNQQVSGSSPLAGSNLALIERCASGPVLIVALLPQFDPYMLMPTRPVTVASGLLPRSPPNRSGLQACR